MKKTILTISLVIITIIFNSCSTLFVNEEPEYVKVNGTHFELNGKPYYFLGGNYWYAVYLAGGGEIGDRPKLLKELDILKSLGINNLRIIGASEESYISNVLTPGILEKPGKYNEELLDGLDFLLSEMKKRDMHAIIFLTNTWEWSGGMSQYNAWVNDSSKINPRLPMVNYNDFINYSASFYRNEEAKEIYYNYIYKIINRKNNYSGMYYYEDPTIMAWQLANEPRPGQGEEGKKWFDEYYRWINSTALFIHKLDHNHLVSTGSEGIAGSLDSSEVFINAHRSKYINYLTFHLWPREWGWYKVEKSDSTYPAAEMNSLAYINEHIKIARELGKPIVMEEFGLPRDYGAWEPGSPVTMRNKFFNTIINLVYDSAANNAPIAGANFWVWGGDGSSNNMNYKWGFGRKLGGGIDYTNSIFQQDTATINIIKRFAEKFNLLTGVQASAKN